MDEKEINTLIEKRILEAKLDIADRKFNYLVILAGGLLAIFGLFFPIWQANTSKDKVDKAVEEMKIELKSIAERNDKEISKYSENAKIQLNEMADYQTKYFNSSSNKIDKEMLSYENKFKELAGTQLRKPSLMCYFNGKSIENIVLSLNEKTHEITFELKNLGDATAKNIFARLYLNTNKNVELFGSFNSHNYSDEPTYNKVYSLNSDFRSIDPKDSQPIVISVETEEKGSIVIPALLKIYYEQPEPIKYNFTIKVDYN